MFACTVFSRSSVSDARSFDDEVVRRESMFVSSGSRRFGSNADGLGGAPDRSKSGGSGGGGSFKPFSCARSTSNL